MTDRSDPPAAGGTALLLVDVINPLDFPEADGLLKMARPMADRLAALARRARASGVPVVYANDNFGRWRSDLKAVVDACRTGGCRGRELAEALHPDPADYFILKPKHSAFYRTPLDLLLRHLKADRLVIGGIAGDICVLFTAHDAYMRDFKVIVPSDGTASNTEEADTAAHAQMRRVLKAEFPTCADVRFPTGEGGGR